MKVALIPPRGLENYALVSKFHLALAIPELLNRGAYGGMYKRAAKLGDYVILDNGANEKQLAPLGDLMNMADRITCNEVVLPDAMYLWNETISLVRAAAKQATTSAKLMAVVQGQSEVQLRNSVPFLNEIPQVTVVGIPRHTLVTCSRSAVRIDLANWIQDHFPDRFEIHFLGTNPVWRGEIAAAAKYAPHVRSVDTSLPFNYALAYKNLATSKTPVGRPKDYFDRDWTHQVDVSLLRQNIYTLMEWANAKPREEAPSGAM